MPQIERELRGSPSEPSYSIDVAETDKSMEDNVKEKACVLMAEVIQRLLLRHPNWSQIFLQDNGFSGICCIFATTLVREGTTEGETITLFYPAVSS